MDSLLSLFLALKAPKQEGNSKFFFFLAFIPGFLCGLLLFSLPMIGKFFDLEYTFLFKDVNYLFKISLLAFLNLLALSIGFRMNVLRADQKLAIQLARKNKLIELKNAQNELLLKEIHHRVKNNLETVSSLLELQSAQVKDGKVQNVMQASRSRVQSMSILHQKLYQGENLASIEMKDYFKNLAESILDTYDAWEQVKVNYDMQEIELDIDTAVPIGLIVNELLTNALKYAFPDGEKGKVCLSLKQVDSKGLQLVVADNGIGNSVANSPKGTGFGSQLINLLTKQLNGTMTEKNADGMRYIFEFKHSVWH